jgi:hypothetical protein
MPKRIVNLRGDARPILDIASYGRRGPGVRSGFSPGEIAQAARTVRRVPEVMVKVSGGARTVRGVARHLDYLEQRADLETDDGERISEKGLGRQLLEDWNLDLDEHRRHTARAIAAGRKPPKLVHNLVFSMPKGTPPEKLHQAVRKFAFEKFALQHRYAMALHTDQANPHVHVVVKAVSEQGERLYIRKATLREWRQDFARYLREYGVEANATERAVRGASRQQRKDGIYRAARRGESTFMRERAESVARELAGGGVKPEAGHVQLSATRRAVVAGWRAFGEAAEREGLAALAAEVNRFVDRMPSARTDRQIIAELLMARVRAREPARTL